LLFKIHVFPDIKSEIIGRNEVRETNINNNNNNNDNRTTIIEIKEGLTILAHHMSVYERVSIKYIFENMYM